MPINVFSSDLAYARIESGRVTLWYSSLLEAPGYFVLVRDRDGRETERLGPFEWEDEAMDAAAERFGTLSWSTH
jgi:hypothetical protein